MDMRTLLADCRHASAYALKLEKLLYEAVVQVGESRQLQDNLVVHADRLVALAECIRVQALHRARQLQKYDERRLAEWTSRLP